MQRGHVNLTHLALLLHSGVQRQRSSMRVALAQASWLTERSSLQLGERVVVVAESGTAASALEQQQQEQQQPPRPMTVTTLSTAPGIFLAQDFLPVSVCDDIVALVADLAPEKSGHRGADVYTVSYVCVESFRVLCWRL